MEIRVLDTVHREDIRLKNDPFPVYGRLIPNLAEGKWDYSIVRYAEAQEMCFPDEAYDFDAMAADHVIVAAYEENRCVGLAIFRDSWFKYLYLEDLKVCGQYRGKGIASAMMDQGLQEAHKRNYNGIYAVCQDNNLDACRFYLKYGFEIGGFDNRVYRGTSQQDKADIYFYLDR